MASRHASRWLVAAFGASLACVTWLGMRPATIENQALGSSPAISTLATDDQPKVDKKPKYPNAPNAENVKLVPDEWKTAPRTPLAKGEIDRLLAEARKNEEPAGKASPITDEQFIRRVTLDVCGKLPSAEDVQAFVADTDSAKRSKLIDRLLASDDFARYWGRYFRDVLLWRATDLRIVARLPRTIALEGWMIGQLKANRSWAEITRDLITSTKPLQHRMHDGGESGFLLAHTGEDGAVERASDVSRVFLGIRIQCAQCHDHPDDIWKRRDFHELAAFFGRTSDRSNRTEQGGVIELFGLSEGEYQMPDLQDPKKTSTVHPRFITKEEVPTGLPDAERRKALADLITSKDNYWFAAAFANRVWGMLMGQGFYQPVDNMGPLQEATYPQVLLRLADGFRATNHDIKGLFRVVLNSEAYQSEFRMGKSFDEHLRFAGTYPSRLSGEALWLSLYEVLGPFPGENSADGVVFRGGAGVTAGPFSSANPALVYLVKQLFDADPSLKADEVESSITQAMMLMNNKKLNAPIKATGDTALAKLLTDHKKDDSAIQILYLKALARKPTARELETCMNFVQRVGKREDAFEDILWTLVNSTEFQTKR